MTHRPDLAPKNASQRGGDSGSLYRVAIRPNERAKSGHAAENGRMVHLASKVLFVGGELALADLHDLGAVLDNPEAILVVFGAQQ